MLECTKQNSSHCSHAYTENTFLLFRKTIDECVSIRIHIVLVSTSTLALFLLLGQIIQAIPVRLALLHVSVALESKSCRYYVLVDFLKTE